MSFCIERQELIHFESRLNELAGVVALNGKPFLDGGKGKVFQFSTNVSVARELNPGHWRHLGILVFIKFNALVLLQI